MGPTWGPPRSCRPHVGPMLAPRTLLSGTLHSWNGNVNIKYHQHWSTWDIGINPLTLTGDTLASMVCHTKHLQLCPITVNTNFHEHNLFQRHHVNGTENKQWFQLVLFKFQAYHFHSIISDIFRFWDTHVLTCHPLDHRKQFSIKYYPKHRHLRSWEFI